MASNTERLDLLIKDPIADGNDTFNIKTMMNDNWKKIDEKVALVDADGKVVNKDGTPAGGGDTAEATSIEDAEGLFVATNVEDALTELKKDDATHKAEDATLTTKGHVQLSDSVTSTSKVLAATPSAVKKAMDRADAAFLLGNSTKEELVDALLSLDPSLPITHESTWQEILIATGQISTGKKYADGQITSLPSSVYVIDSFGFNTQTPAVAFDFSLLDFIPSIVVFVANNLAEAINSGAAGYWHYNNVKNSGASNYGNSSAPSTGQSLFRIPYVQGLVNIPVNMQGKVLNWYAYE